MPEKKRSVLFSFFALLGVAVPIACQSKGEIVTVEVTRVVVETVVKTVDVAVEVEVEVVPEATVEVKLPKVLTVCMSQEPATLYPYGDINLAEEAILHGIFENDFVNLSYQYQPQGIVKSPDLDEGDAVLNSIEVFEGSIIVDANDDVVILKEGVSLINSDGEEQVFDGTPMTMNQLQVDFSMKPRVWSDGTPVTAADSVYSFKVESDPDTPTSKYDNVRTAVYEATGDLTVRWTGIPGYLHTPYYRNFWRPLPRHAWADLSPADLLEAEISSHMPIGDGPFKIVEWITGNQIRLKVNEHYYLTDQGLPRVEEVVFKFIPDNKRLINELLSGNCDIVTQDSLDISQTPLLLEAEANGLLMPYYQTGAVYEHIDFGIDSWGRYGDGIVRPDWFEDVRVRQALVMCTDRQRMIDEILYGRSEIMNSYVPGDHPLYPIDITVWPFDVAAANQLLDDAGYLDTDGDRIRQDPETGKEFRVTFTTATDYDMNQRLAQIFWENMSDCGISVELHYMPADEWFASGSESPLFGRRFDLGQLAWPIGDEPLCFLYSSWEITGPAGETNRDTRVPYGGWGAANNTGWWDPEYDKACRQAIDSIPGTAEHISSHMEAQRIFAENVPVIPLFPRVKVAVVRPGVRNFSLQPSQPSALWNLFEIDLQR